MSFNFPDLKIPEICRSLSDLCGVDLQEGWFKKPDAAQWQDICRRCVSEITGSPEDLLLQQPLFSSEFDYPEIYSDAVPVNHLIAVMSRIMPSMYVPDFNGSDILSPTPQRVKKICCAIINFLSFKHNRVPVYEDFKMEIERDREHHDALLRRNEELKLKINKIRADRAQQEPDIQKCQGEVEVISMRVQEQQRSKQAIQLGITEIKTNNAEKKAKADHLRCEILKGKEEEEKLSLKIVQSPEKVRAEQEHLKLQLNELKNDVERKRHRLTEIQAMRKSGRQAEIDGLKGLQILEAMKASIDKENVIQTEIAQMFDKIQEHKEQERDLCTRKEQLKQMSSTRQEKLSKISLQHQSRLRVLQEQCQALRNEKEELLAKQNCGTERKSELLEYKKTIEQDISNKQKSTEKHIEGMKEMYSRLLEKVDEYNKNFGLHWDEIRCLVKE